MGELSSFSFKQKKLHVNLKICLLPVFSVTNSERQEVLFPDFSCGSFEWQGKLIKGFTHRTFFLMCLECRSRLIDQLICLLALKCRSGDTDQLICPVCRSGHTDQLVCPVCRSETHWSAGLPCNVGQDTLISWFALYVGQDTLISWFALFVGQHTLISWFDLLVGHVEWSYQAIFVDNLQRSKCLKQWSKLCLPRSRSQIWVKR